MWNRNCLLGITFRSPGFKWSSRCTMLIFCAMFCTSLFVLLHFFFWPLCSLSFFDLQILVILLVSSNSSLSILQTMTIRSTKIQLKQICVLIFIFTKHLVKEKIVPTSILSTMYMSLTRGNPSALHSQHSENTQNLLIQKIVNEHENLSNIKRRLKVNEQLFYVYCCYTFYSRSIIWGPSWSVPITTKVASSNPAHREAYSIQHYVIKFISNLQQVGGFEK